MRREWERGGARKLYSSDAGEKENNPEGEGSLSAEIILEALDIVLSQIGSALDFDKYELFDADVLDTVCRSHGDVNRFADADGEFVSIERDFGRSSNHHPMLRTALVRLIT